MAEQHQFKAEIKQLLNILIHSLYQDREIFLRELISNASDALTRLKFEMLTTQDVHDAEAELAIWLTAEEEEDAKWLVIRDSGLGMTAQELVENLGTIAQSGARSFLSRLEEGQETPADIIGRFGVGFYSVFMVADEVRVVSRSYRPDAEAAVWISHGDDTFRVEAADKTSRGTEIRLRLKSDAAEFTEAHRLRNIVKKHSDYVGYPIYVDETQANASQSLWRTNPSEVEADAYVDFYRQMTLDFEEPIETVHFHSDAPIALRALLFFPARREPNPLALRKEPGLKLYSNNVLIQEFCTDLLPDWLNWVDGVVDSEDLPLNVSRETVHNNRLMRQLAKVLRKRVLRAIRQMADKDQERFERFWTEYGRSLKEGIAIEPTRKDDIVPLLHFRSSKADRLTSLQQYVERMPAEQEAIYYVLADSMAAATYSPHLDPLKARDWEVLYFTDAIDAFIVNGWDEFEGKKLTNVDSADLDLPQTEEEQDEEAASEKAINLFVGRCVSQLGERVAEVKLSKVLRDSPVRLIAPENGALPAGFDRIQRMMNQNYEVPQRVLEVNKTHPIISNAALRLENDEADEVVNLIIEQLYESALMQEGLHPNPADMLPRIQRLMALAVANSA